MLRLIKLERNKFKFSVYNKWIVLANLILLFFMFLIPFAERKDNGVIAFGQYSEAFNILNLLVGATFTIFASVLIAKLIIEEYKNKTILVLFSYPVNRKALLGAKLIIVVCWSLTTIILSSIFISASFIVMDNFFKFVPEQLSVLIIIQQLLKILTNSVATAGLSLIPLYFGMKKKSVPVTIISSILIVTVLGFNTNSFSVGSIILIPTFLAVLGIFIAYIAIRKVEVEDVS
ncbi:ABC transporter permease [Bacillus solimangrovi]|uniref:ABC transporter permease n=1 Tax=Bacillus solimangrovi TaxID=1305675 RepID=A0A1E5LK12_9BACI|nr:ABC transporter permease [Bacillus solimangrovi]OEH94415.1 hypothetical protein BFG57_08110 [Bacillus solimangrovi]